MAAPKRLNLALRFLLELTAFASLGYWGATVSASAVVRAVVAVALLLAAAVFWGLFVAPRARVVLPSGVRMTLGLLVFAAAAAALADRGHGRLGAALAVLALVNVALMLAWHQDRIIPRSAPW